VEAERRQVTVLFTDMVGFTAFSERSGEEAAYTLMRSLSKLMGESVRDQGGIVQGFTGDGIMAVFGAPIALEDAPLRACRAALAILQRLKQAGPDLEAKYGVRPQMRIGVNTGAAVVGKVEDDVDADVTVLGDTVNFAARLQALAEPDWVLMSEATHRLVQGMVEASFAGGHEIKGKAEPQKTYRLNAVRQGATRFEAAVSRGLSAFVGRERELEILERELDRARSELRVIDLAAEPGMGKSRLLHEFRQRISKDRAFVLSGSCSPDGQQTPFLPFIEVVRGSFRISVGEAEKEITQKLETGLSALGLHSVRNLGLLLHLLGLNAPEGALTGLDGVLIGLRTRELLLQLLDARCRLSPVVMIVEDLHWIDSASENVLGSLTEDEVKFRLLLLTSRRPEYVEHWLDLPVVTKLPLEPLPASDIRHLAETRLGVAALPESLARQITEKADGNPLFAEEIITFLKERGILSIVGGKLDFDASAVAATLPASVQGVLTARVDRLAPRDRAILQAASVIGRQFNPLLLAAAVGGTDIDDSLAAMQALDLIHPTTKTDNFEFKHALVRDALYNSLLSEARVALHLKLAEEIERRSGNRLTEVAEVLAHHYGQTDRDEKAFAYLSMAGSKCLSVYSLDEASTHLTAALSLIDKDPTSVSDDAFTDFFVCYALLSTTRMEVHMMIDVITRYLSRINRIGDDQRAIIIRHHFVFALLWNARYRDASVVQLETTMMAERLGDSLSKAYALAAEIIVSAIFAPKSLHEFEKLKRDAIQASSDISDAYIQNWTRWVIGWDAMHRGRINDARDSARELTQIGRKLNDPRSIGFWLNLLGFVAVACDSYADALEYSDQSLSVAVTGWDRAAASIAKGMALAMLRRTEEAEKLLQEQRHRIDLDGDFYSLTAVEPVLGVCTLLRGNFAGGIGLLEESISRRVSEGYRFMENWVGLNLAEVYLEIIGGNERPPLMVLLKNLPFLLRVRVTAFSRIRALLKRAQENQQFDANGYFIGKSETILGLLYKIKKKPALAAQHLTNAKRILTPFGQTPMLARVETALAELGV
jgi:class 3 adenylate cyclase/tetratricopeptide (TPR) repeat protein